MRFHGMPRFLRLRRRFPDFPLNGSHDHFRLDRRFPYFPLNVRLDRFLLYLRLLFFRDRRRGICSVQFTGQAMMDHPATPVILSGQGRQWVRICSEGYPVTEKWLMVP